MTRLGTAGYTPAMTRHVYQTLAGRALTALKAGHAVIADAVYAGPHDREEIAAVARDAGVPFIGDAPNVLNGILFSFEKGKGLPWRTTVSTEISSWSSRVS